MPWLRTMRSLIDRLKDEIIARLENGDWKAWFCLVVTATWKNYRNSTYLGCVSIRPEDEVEECEADLYSCHEGRSFVGAEYEDKA